MQNARGLVLPIIREEAARNGYTVNELIAQNHHAHIVAVRHYAMWRARRETQRSWCEIARFFCRDHTTVLHAYQKIEALPEHLRGDIPPRHMPKPKPKNQNVVKHPRRRSRRRVAEIYTGKPCPHGHDGTRYVSNGRCVQCRVLEDKARDQRKRFFAEAAE